MPEPNETDLMFGETIIALKNGAVVAELSDRLRKLIKAVRETGNAGSLTLTMKVAPAVKGDNGGDVVSVEAAVNTKTPAPKLGTSIFFTTDAGGLVRNDPRQMDLLAEKEPAE
ncbi:MAG TPA: hypothetical protein PKY73_19290 [Hyphomonas sp.]|nr:hypothetical protein [Hyphomonas sp.]